MFLLRHEHLPLGVMGIEAAGCCTERAIDLFFGLTKLVRAVLAVVVHDPIDIGGRQPHKGIKVLGIEPQRGLRQTSHFVLGRLRK